MLAEVAAITKIGSLKHKLNSEDFIGVLDFVIGADAAFAQDPAAFLQSIFYISLTVRSFFGQIIIFQMRKIPLNQAAARSEIFGGSQG